MEKKEEIKPDLFEPTTPFRSRKIISPDIPEYHPSGNIPEFIPHKAADWIFIKKSLRVKV